MDANKQWEEYHKKSQASLKTQQSQDCRKCKKSTSEIEVLKQQLEIYKDDFAMERRDRVRAVMELKKLRIENERLKNSSSR